MTPFEQFSARNGGSPAFRLVKDGRALIIQHGPPEPSPVIALHARPMAEAAREFARHMASLAAWAAANFGADPEAPTADDVALLRGCNRELSRITSTLAETGLLEEG